MVGSLIIKILFVMVRIVLLILFYFLLFSCDDSHNNINDDGYLYEISFHFSFGQDSFPDDYPREPYFTPLVGFSHLPDFSLIAAGETCSPGLRLLAEKGDNTTLCDELVDYIISDEVHYRSVSQVGVGYGEGSSSVLLLLEEMHSCITCVSHLGPSPDWFVGVVNVSMLEDGVLLDEKTVVAEVYDAGTDGGISYYSANDPLSPTVPISYMVSSPLGDGTTLYSNIATVTLRRVD